MERVNHVDVVKVRGSRLVGDVDRVLKGKIPYGESFEFCVSRFDAAFVFVVKLR